MGGGLASLIAANLLAIRGGSDITLVITFVVAICIVSAIAVISTSETSKDDLD